MSEATILERIQKDLVAAMKARDEATTSTLRMLKAALMEAKTRKAKDETLSDDEAMAVLRRYVKQRREAAEAFANDAARVASEEKEIAVTERYLPAAMSGAELDTLVAEAIASTGASGPKDMGKVIGAVLAKAAGRADGKAVSDRVKARLAG